MGVSAAAANAFIKQHNVIYFNSHLGFGFLFFFSMQFLSGMNSPLLFILEGELKKVTEEKEDEEPGDSPGHFFQKCVSRQENQAERHGVTQQHLLLRAVGGGARSTMCGHSLQRPSPSLA